MAEIHLKSGQRLKAYEALFLLNRFFRSIVWRLQELDTTHIFNPQHLRELRRLTRELQSEVNHHLLETLYAAEERGLVQIRQSQNRKREETAKVAAKLTLGLHPPGDGRFFMQF